MESLLTVLATCQQHQQNAFTYLTACCRAFFRNAPAAIDSAIRPTRISLAVYRVTAHVSSYFPCC